MIDGTGRPALRDAVVLIDGPRIAAVGKRSEVEVPHGARVIDASGRTVVPGLIDSHTHFLSMGYRLGHLQLDDAESIGDIVGRLGEYIRARRLPKGKWAQGRGWDDQNLAERRYPDRRDLDEASPDNPVALTTDMRPHDRPELQGPRGLRNNEGHAEPAWRRDRQGRRRRADGGPQGREGNSDSPHPAADLRGAEAGAQGRHRAGPQPRRHHDPRLQPAGRILAPHVCETLRRRPRGGRHEAPVPRDDWEPPREKRRRVAELRHPEDRHRRLNGGADRPTLRALRQRPVDLRRIRR